MKLNELKLTDAEMALVQMAVIDMTNTLADAKITIHKESVQDALNNLRKKLDL